MMLLYNSYHAMYSTDNMELYCGDTVLKGGSRQRLSQVWCFSVMCWNTGVQMVMCDVVRTWCVALFGAVCGVWT